MCINDRKKPSPHTVVDEKSLNLSFWNIHGYKSSLIGDKFSDNEFLNIFRDDHIVGLVELHTESKPSMSGFKLIKQKIRKKLHKGPKISGGLALFVKSEYAHLVKPVKNDNEDSIWVKVSKEGTDSLSDLYIGTLYLSPARDETGKNEGRASLEVFFNEIRKFKEKGTVIAQGDINAHTSTLPDYLESDKTDEEMGIKNYAKPLSRNSEDKKPPNERGKHFVDLCKAYDMLIVNGRKTGDIFGKYTSFQWNGARVVDYVLSERVQQHNILDFKVGPFRPWLSDHCPLHYSISLKNDIEPKEDDKGKDSPTRFHCFIKTKA